MFGLLCQLRCPRVVEGMQTGWYHYDVMTSHAAERYHLRRGSQSTQQDEEEQFTQHTTHKPHDNSSLHTLVGIGRIHPQRGLEEFTRLLLLNSTSQARRVTLAASAVQETACRERLCGGWKNSPTRVHFTKLLVFFISYVSAIGVSSFGCGSHEARSRFPLGHRVWRCGAR